MLDNKINMVQANETLDDLIINDLKIIQPRQGYRFSLDAVLLAHFPELNKVNRIVDLGTGNGVIPLLLSQRNESVHITGIEIQKQMADRACRSIEYNQLRGRISILHGDINEITDFFPGGSADLVVSNPPFWRKNEGKISINQEEAVARHELTLTLAGLMEKARYVLRYRGRLAIIQRADRLPEVIEAFERNKMSICKLRMVHSYNNKEAKQILVEGIKDARTNLRILPPLIIYQENGQYTRELLSIYFGEG